MLHKVNTQHPPSIEMQGWTMTHIRDRPGDRYQPAAWTLKERDTKLMCTKNLSGANYDH